MDAATRLLERGDEVYAGGRYFSSLLGQTAVDRDTDVVPHRAAGYVLADNQPGRYQRAAFFSMDVAGGAGAIRSTPRDLAKWHQALFAGQVISHASLTQMLTPGVLNDGRKIVRGDAPIALGTPGYGFGLEIGSFDGLQAIGHGGAVIGFTAYVVTFPKLDLSVSIMINTSPNKHEPFHEIQRAMIAGVDTAGRQSERNHS